MVDAGSIPGPPYSASSERRYQSVVLVNFLIHKKNSLRVIVTLA